MTYRGVNALTESLNGLYETEVLGHGSCGASLGAVELATLEWVNWYNHSRIMDRTGNCTPAEIVADYYRQASESAHAA